MITGTTKLLGVIGAPVGHSLSPVIQNAALHDAGLDYVYAALPVRPCRPLYMVCVMRGSRDSM